MKNAVFKKLSKINRALSDNTKSKLERIATRSAKLDPNNIENQEKPILKNGKKDDGFEHRKSAETANLP